MATKAELESQLAELVRQTEAPHIFDPQQHKDETRAKIALFVVKAYFYLIGAVLIGVPLYNLKVDAEHILSVETLVSTLASATSGIFGFVVGYYFKGTE